MKRIVFIINQDWYFCLHWMERAKAVQKAGFDVIIAVPQGEKIDEIMDAGFKVIQIPLSRNGISIFKEFKAFLILFSKIKEIAPDLIVNITIKPNFYGSLIALLFGLPVVNNVTGLGSVFVSQKNPYKMIRQLVLTGFKLLSARDKIKFLFENSEDQQLFIDKGVTKPEKTLLMPGSGVNPDIYFCPPLRAVEPVIVLFAARLLWSKGLATLVDASAILKKKHVQCQIHVAGIIDKGNSDSIPYSFIQEWERLGLIEFLGKCDNMPQQLRNSHIAVLPTTYGEGIPRFLIEAASCGLPVVTTDVPGCRTFVSHGKTGLLVKPGSKEELADALQLLINSEKQRKQMGDAGRKLVLEQYSESIVIEKTLKIYKEMV